MKVGDLVRIRILEGVGDRIGLIVGRDKRSDLMKHELQKGLSIAMMKKESSRHGSI